MKKSLSRQLRLETMNRQRMEKCPKEKRQSGWSSNQLKCLKRRIHRLPHLKQNPCHLSRIKSKLFQFQAMKKWYKLQVAFRRDHMKSWRSFLLQNAPRPRLKQNSIRSTLLKFLWTQKRINKMYAWIRNQLRGTPMLNSPWEQLRQKPNHLRITFLTTTLHLKHTLFLRIIRPMIITTIKAYPKRKWKKNLQ